MVIRRFKTLPGWAQATMIGALLCALGFFVLSVGNPIAIPFGMGLGGIVGWGVWKSARNHEKFDREWEEAHERFESHEFTWYRRLYFLAPPIGSVIGFVVFTVWQSSLWWGLAGIPSGFGLGSGPAIWLFKLGGPGDKRFKPKE